MHCCLTRNIMHRCSMKVKSTNMNIPSNGSSTRKAVTILMALGLLSSGGCRAVNKAVTKAVIQRAKSPRGEIHYRSDAKYTLNDSRLEQVEFAGSVSVEDVNVHYQRGLQTQADCIANKTAHLLWRVEKRTGINISRNTIIYLLRLDEIPDSFEIKLKFDPNEFQLPLFVKAGRESCETILADNQSYPYAFVHELVETSLIFPRNGGCVLPDLAGRWLFVRGQVTNATRWFRDGFANYAGYVACESICQDPDFTDQQIVRLAHTRQHQRPFSSLSRVGKKLFSWHQYSRRNLSKGYYSAALGLFLVIRQRFGEEAIHDIMIEIGKRDYLDGPDLMEIASDALNTDIAELVKDFSFPKTGLEMTALTSAIALNKGLGIEEGLLVTKVDPNSPAEQVSIGPNDVIARVNDKPVRNNLDYELAIFKLMDQQAVELALWRKDEGELVVELPLRNGP